MLTIFERFLKTTILTICPGKHFFCCPVTISDTDENHWLVNKFKSWLWWELLTFRGWHWTSLLNPWFHHLLQNSNMLYAIIIIITTTNIIIFRTRTCSPPFSAWSKRSTLQVWRWWSWPPGYKSFLRETNMFKYFKCASKKTGHTMKERSSSSDELSCRCRMEELDD